MTPSPNASVMSTVWLAHGTQSKRKSANRVSNLMHLRLIFRADCFRIAEKPRLKVSTNPVERLIK